MPLFLYLFSKYNLLVCDYLFWYDDAILIVAYIVYYWCKLKASPMIVNSEWVRFPQHYYDHFKSSPKTHKPEILHFPGGHFHFKHLQEAFHIIDSDFTVKAKQTNRQTKTTEGIVMTWSFCWLLFPKTNSCNYNKKSLQKSQSQYNPHDSTVLLCRDLPVISPTA